MVDNTDNTMVKTIMGGGRQTMVDNTDNTMVKRIKGERGETNNGGQDRQHNGQENKGGEGGDKQWWTRQTTQWSRQ